MTAALESTRDAMKASNARSAALRSPKPAACTPQLACNAAASESSQPNISFTPVHGSRESSFTSRPQSTPTPEIATTDVSDVEDGALVLAKQFMSTMGSLARKCNSRAALSELYLTIVSAWASPEVQADESLHRHFKHDFFAISHDMKLVHVHDHGRSLFWNRYRYNEGNLIGDEREKYRERQQDRAGTEQQGNLSTGYHGQCGVTERLGLGPGLDTKVNIRVVSVSKLNVLPNRTQIVESL